MGPTRAVDIHRHTMLPTKQRYSKVKFKVRANYHITVLLAQANYMHRNTRINKSAEFATARSESSSFVCANLILQQQ